MKSQKKSVFLIIDGNSLLYRAFYALPLLQNQHGQQTNAIYGFTNMLYKLLEDEPPEYLAVVFDPPKPSFRARIDPTYKANREKTPAELTEQVYKVREILRAMKIAVFEIDDYEADDVIGTLADMAVNESVSVKVLTGDTDLLQLVDDGISVVLTRKGISQMEVFNRQHLKEEMGLTPEQVIDYKALKGDPSDNIPGVPGIGKKTAMNLIDAYSSIEGIYDNLDFLKGKIAENLETYKDQLLSSRKLVTLQREVSLDFHLKDCHYVEPDHEMLLNMFKDLGFKKLTEKIKKEVFGTSGNKKTSYKAQEISTLAELKGVLASFDKDKELSLLVTSEKRSPYWKNSIQHLAFSVEDDCGFYLNSFLLADKISQVWKEIAKTVNSSSVLITYQSKTIHHYLLDQGLDMKVPLFDTKLGFYLVEPTRGNYSIDRLLELYAGIARGDFHHEDNDNPEAAWLAFCSSKLFNVRESIEQSLKEQQLEELFHALELPLTRILVNMERQGMTVNVNLLNEISDEINISMSETENRIYEIAGEHFNLNSPKQLSEILFDKLDLPLIRKTKTGRSTDARVLEELSGEHEIAKLILHYRQLAKLTGTYLNGLVNHIDSETGKLHTTFNQTATATGRLSSSDPNLQNIPIRLKEGRRIRRAFIPSAGNRIFLAADYSQVELRVLAHLSQDRILMEAFQQGEDIHRRTAAEVNSLPPNEVTPVMREKAKAVNFGIIYGSSDYGLSQGLKIPRAEAKQYIDSYFERYSGVKKYMDSIVERAKASGYVTTLLNRRRYLPDINSSNHNLRSFAERMALNTPIQGSAADIIKLAMINIDNVLREGGFKAWMFLQIHDELLFEVEEAEFDIFAPVLKKEMEQAMVLSVPLQVDVKWGTNWEDLKKLD